MCSNSLCRVAALVVGTLIVSAGCANELSNDEDIVEDVGVAAEALNQDVACGTSVGFPTWSWWGWTWVRFANRDATGTKIIDATYQAGAGSPKSATVSSASCEFEEPIERRECEISQQWAGLTLYVHNRGYWDATSDGQKGAYHPCLTATDGPTLNVNTQ